MIYNVYLSLGSNLGDRKGNVEKACSLISERIGKIEKISALYESEPWGFSHGNPFYNQVILVKSTHAATVILRKIKVIELEMGRVKKNHGYEARTIDIDILFYGAKKINTSDLQIPHIRIPERRFVLIPLNEIASHLIHPENNTPICDLLEVCTDLNWVRKLYL